MKKRYMLVILLLALLVISVRFTVQEVPLETRHDVLGQFEAIYQAPTLVAHLAAAKEVLQQSRPELSESERLQRQQGNSPFLLKPAETCESLGGPKRGMVITHGLTDSPYYVRDFAEAMTRRCFTVFGVLMPGHGTQPGDLREVVWQQWLAAVEQGIAWLRPEVDELYLAGFSTGASLNLYVLSRRNDIAGLVLFAPAIKVADMARFAGPVQRLSPWLSRASWLSVFPDHDRYRYESFAMNAVAQVFKLTQVLQREWSGRRANVPIFVVSAWEDATVSTDSTIQWLLRHANQYALRLYSSEKLMFETNRIERYPWLADSSITLVNTGGDDRLLSHSHAGLAISPSNPYYGQNGEHRGCLHYLHGSPKRYKRCIDGEAQYLGELTPKHLVKGVVQRLGYNPDWQGMLQHIDHFFQWREITGGSAVLQ